VDSSEQALRDAVLKLARESEKELVNDAASWVQIQCANALGITLDELLPQDQADG
jgi:hypothetical protein